LVPPGVVGGAPVAGLWHTLDAYTDPTVARAAPRRSAGPGAPRAVTPCDYPDGRPLHDAGRLARGALLAVADGAATWSGWPLVLLGRAQRDPERYWVCVPERRSENRRCGVPTYRAARDLLYQIASAITVA